MLRGAHSRLLCPCSRCRCFIIRCSECGTQFHSNADRLFCEYRCKQKAAEEAKEIAFRAIHAHVAARHTDESPSRLLVLGDAPIHPQVSPSSGTPLIVLSSASVDHCNRLDCPTVAPHVSHSNDFTSKVPSPTMKEGSDRAPINHTHSASQISLSDSCSNTRHAESTPLTTTPNLRASSAASLQTSFMARDVCPRETMPSQMITDSGHGVRLANNHCRIAHPLATSNTSRTSSFLSPHASLGPGQKETELTLLPGPSPLLYSLAGFLDIPSQSASTSSSVSSPSSMTASTEELLRASRASRLTAPSVARASDVVHPVLAPTSDGIAPYFETESPEKISAPPNSGASSSSNSLGVKSTKSSSTQRHTGVAPSKSRRNSKQGTPCQCLMR